MPVGSNKILFDWYIYIYIYVYKYKWTWQMLNMVNKCHVHKICVNTKEKE